MAMHFFPLGKSIFAASMINAFEAAQAASRVLVILNFQLSSAAAGRELGLPTSPSLRIATVVLLFTAASQRFTCSAV